MSEDYLRPEVQKFAEEMEKQLRANEHKGGWKDCDKDFLYSELMKNITTLVVALMFNNQEEHITRRCANIANFAMMIADNFGAKAGGEG